MQRTYNYDNFRKSFIKRNLIIIRFKFVVLLFLKTALSINDLFITSLGRCLLHHAYAFNISQGKNVNAIKVQDTHQTSCIFTEQDTQIPDKKPPQFAQRRLGTTKAICKRHVLHKTGRYITALSRMRHLMV